MISQDNRDIIRRTFITIFFWFWAAIGTIFSLFYITIGMLLGASPRWRRHQMWNCIAGFTSGIMQICGIWSYKLIDRRKDKSDYYKGSYIITANHLSLADAAYTPSLPYDIVFMWASKWSWTPIGWLLLTTDNIPVDTGSDESKKNALRLCKDKLDDEMSIFIYPEGKRGNDPTTMVPFKTGAFRIAVQTCKPILPITIFGTMKACNGFICDFSDVEIIIDEPIQPGDDYHDLCHKTRTVIMNNINDRYHLE